MTATILVVDDVPANLRFLEARLRAEYYHVLSAASGAQALDILARETCDLVLLDVMMPGMDGFETCRRIKGDASIFHVPVIMVTALDAAEERNRALEAGADDFLTKPLNETALLTRVRSLLRLKVLQDELRLQAISGNDVRARETLSVSMADKGLGGTVLLVDDRPSSAERICDYLHDQQTIHIMKTPKEALAAMGSRVYDAILVSMNLAHADALRLCSQFRSSKAARTTPILVIADPEDDRLLRALELGVNDYTLRPIDQHELSARVRMQVRKWRYMERLRQNLQQSAEQAVTDGLTGLYNRHYLEDSLSAMANSPISRIKPMSVLVLDIDHFKAVNDSHGHEAGDEVLREFAARVRASVRAHDIACRLGGEEFVVIMPDTAVDVARAVAERIRAVVASEAFVVRKGLQSIPITVSIGMASRSSENEDVERLIRRADRSVYVAKSSGRNCVVVAA